MPPPPPLSKTIITQFPDVPSFFRLLENNPGLVLLKMGATWCGPCKKIRPVVDAFFASSPDNVVCCEIDVDECVELYSFFKKKRMVNGIPVLMCFKKHNTSFIPDDSVTGADASTLDAFFQRCSQHLMSVRSKR